MGVLVSNINNMTKKKFTEELEWLRRRLDGHSKPLIMSGNQTSRFNHVSMEYVNARIDDLISTYGV